MITQNWHPYLKLTSFVFYMFQAHPFLLISQTVNLIFQLIFRSSAFLKEKFFFSLGKGKKELLFTDMGSTFERIVTHNDSSRK